MLDNTAMPAEADPMLDQAAESRPDECYQVGYKKPPRHSRFKKGQSGNPSGRPRRFRNLARMFEDALNETVTIIEHDGRRRQITKREAIAKSLAKRAVEGDGRAIQAVFRLMGQMDSEQGVPFVIQRSGGDAML